MTDLRRYRCRMVAVALWMGLLWTAIPGRAEETLSRAAFVQRVEAAVNRSDVAALKALSAPGAKTDFAWAAQPAGMLTRSTPWRAGLLELPGAAGREDSAFLTFSRYQFCESAGDHLYRLAVTPEGPRLGEEIPETDTTGFRVRDHRLTVRFDTPRARARITDRVTVEREASRAEDTVSRFPALILRLNTLYTVRSAKREGASVPFRQAGGFVALPLPAGKRAVYDLAYDGLVTGSNEDFIKPREAALTSYWYPHIGRLPATHSVLITVPKGWTAIGQGEPTGVTTAGRETTFGWKNPLPVCYFTVAAGRYAVTTRRVGGVAVSAYLLRPDVARAQRAIETAGQAVLWFSTHFAAYPYTRYAVVESDTFPPALECYSFTLVNRGLIPLAIVHEVSHTWWGGIMPNTYTRTLWNESFAEYSDGLYQRQTGRFGMHEYNARMMTAAMSSLLGRYSLMEAKDAQDMAQSAIGYGKGSLVLENLERLLGTPRMLTAIRRFLARRVPGEAPEWQDFIDAVAQTAGTEWTGFFPSWLTRTDLPTLRLTGVQTAREGGKYVVSGTVAQEGAIFWTSVPVIVQTEAGQTKAEVALKGREAPFRVAVNSRPAQVALDPNREMLRAGSIARKPPTLMDIQTESGPLLVVYATGGTPEESAAARAVAESQARDIFPFASVMVKADNEITPEMLEAANVLLLGRPESLRLPPAWREALPLRYTPEGIAGASREWQGADLWGLAIMPHPSRPRGFLAHAAGVSPDALRMFRHQGDLDGARSLFVVRGAGKTLYSERPRLNDPTVVTLQ